MQIRFLIALVLGVSVCFSTQSLANDGTFKRPLAKDAVVGGMSFSSGGEIHIAAMIVNVDGRVAVCGVWKEAIKVSGPSTALSMRRKGMERGSIHHGNKTLLRGLLFMNQVSKENYVVGTKANCKLTRKAWQPSYSNKKLKVRIPRFQLID